MKGIFISSEKNASLYSSSIPGISENEVLIKTVCAPAHTLDVLKIRDYFGSFSGTPGFEGSGTVVRSGSSSKSKKLLNKIVCFIKLHNTGTWSEYVACSASDCYIIKEDLGFVKGSTLLLIPLTVMMITKIIKKKKIKVIVNTLGGSCLGKVLQRWCNYKSIDCINIVRTQSKAKELYDIGAKHVLNSSHENFFNEFWNLSQKLKPKCCFDGVGGETGKVVLSLLEKNSVVYLYNTLDPSHSLDIPGKEIFINKKKIKGLWMPDWYMSLSDRKKQKYFKKIQKHHYIYRTDNVQVIPIIDFIPILNTYFSELPMHKVIIDFSDLSFSLDTAYRSSSIKFKESFESSDLKSPQSSSLLESTLGIEPDLILPDINSLKNTIELYKSPSIVHLLDNFPVLDNFVYTQLPDESIYHGQIKDKVPEGLGIIYYPNGDVYQGSFEYGERKGKGKIFYSTGDWFEGSWKENKPAGAGIYYCSQGEIIKGNFLGLDVIGSGVQIMPDGNAYQGSFLSKKRHGKGILRTSDWVYEGKFYDGEFSGTGVIKFTDGKEFSGEFNKNEATGLLKYHDCTYFEGKLLNLKENGEGELINIDGIRKKGIWNDGKLKHYLDHPENQIKPEITEKTLESHEGIRIELEDFDETISALVINN